MMSKSFLLELTSSVAGDAGEACKTISDDFLDKFADIGIAFATSSFEENVLNITLVGDL